MLSMGYRTHCPWQLPVIHVTTRTNVIVFLASLVWYISNGNGYYFALVCCQ